MKFWNCFYNDFSYRVGLGWIISLMVRFLVKVKCFVDEIYYNSLINEDEIRKILYKKLCILLS